MQTIYKTLLLLVLLPATIACENTVQFKGKELDPKMVLNTLINCDADTNSIKISESIFLYSSPNTQLITEPNLKLKVNGVPCNKLWFDKYSKTNSYYNFESLLKPGDKIEIFAETKEYGNLYGFDVIPEPAEIKDVKVKPFEKEDSGKYYQTLITINDNPNEKNYYRVVIKEAIFLWDDDKEPYIEWKNQRVYVDKEIVFYNDIGDVALDQVDSKYCVFSDDLFQGQEYTLNLYIEGGGYGYYLGEQKHYIKAEIHSLSENMYLYLRSREILNNDDFFKEPVKIYTNIQGGFGILGSYKISEKTVIVE